LHNCTYLEALLKWNSQPTDQPERTLILDWECKMTFTVTRKDLCDLINKSFAWFVKCISSLHNCNQNLVPSKTLRFLQTAVSERKRNALTQLPLLQNFSLFFCFLIQNLTTSFSYITWTARYRMPRRSCVLPRIYVIVFMFNLQETGKCNTETLLFCVTSTYGILKLTEPEYTPVWVFIHLYINSAGLLRLTTLRIWNFCFENVTTVLYLGTTS
jgi:hypothetical protein